MFSFYDNLFIFTVLGDELLSVVVHQPSSLELENIVVHEDGDRLQAGTPSLSTRPHSSVDEPACRLTVHSQDIVTQSHVGVGVLVVGQKMRVSVYL